MTWMLILAVVSTVMATVCGISLYDDTGRYFPSRVMYLIAFGIIAVVLFVKIVVALPN